MTSPAGDVRGEAGFTLLELMVVLAIIGLVGSLSLSALSGPMSGPISGRDGVARARLAARDLVTALRATRAAALESNRPAVFQLDRARFGAVDVQAEGKGRPLTFFADGGSTGERFLVQPGGFTVTVDWLSGAVRQTR